MNKIMRAYTRDWTIEERKHNSEFGCMKLYNLPMYSSSDTSLVECVKLHLTNYLHYIMQQNGCIATNH